MRKITETQLTAETIKHYGIDVFMFDGCKVLMQKLDDIIMVDNKSKASYRVLLETGKKTDIYIELLFDSCLDVKNPRTKALNKSKKGNAYVGFLYCPRKGHENDGRALKIWKEEKNYRYPRLQECLRLKAGIFADCGLELEDFTSGRVKYDDVYEYVKAFWHDTVVGHPFDKGGIQSRSLADFGLGERIEDKPQFGDLDFDMQFGGDLDGVSLPFEGLF